MNRSLFIEFWDEMKRLKKKKADSKVRQWEPFTKKDSDRCVDLLDKIAHEFGIDEYLFNSGKNHNISKFKTLRVDVLKNELWNLIDPSQE